MKKVLIVVILSTIGLIFYFNDNKNVSSEVLVQKAKEEKVKDFFLPPLDYTEEAFSIAGTVSEENIEKVGLEKKLKIISIHIPAE